MSAPDDPVYLPCISAADLVVANLAYPSGPLMVLKAMAEQDARQAGRYALGLASVARKSPGSYAGLSTFLRSLADRLEGRA